jgi:hypothetical protein
MIVLNIKLFKGSYDCYGTIAGHDYFCLSNDKQLAVNHMLATCARLDPMNEVRINDLTAPAPEPGK